MKSTVRQKIKDKRNYKHQSNLCEKLKPKDQFEAAKKTFNDNQAPAEVWKATKNLLKYKQNSSPTLLIDHKNNKIIRGGKNISQHLNREYIRRVRECKNKLPQPIADPIINYRRVITKPPESFEIKQINMSELRHAMKKLKLTKSGGFFGITMATIKHCQEVLEPLLLDLTNQVIEKK